jgi:methylated-DNA-[protein]-cysteine S-methyltransferase
MKGTSFQKKVWSALKRIPYGRTRSYKDIAKSIGHPKAFRAVGNANGSNSIPVIPCHRVIESNGGLGGLVTVSR